MAALQNLGDGFHALADEVLRHTYERLRPIVASGKNAEGKPITGTPDSYVGPSAIDCTIAIEYTTTKPEDLSGKFLEDYTKAVACCQKACEVILCTNRPRSEMSAEAVRAKAKVDAKELTIIWGENLAEILDDHRQDLRSEHLGIPLRTVTRYSLIPTLKEQVNRAIQHYLSKSDVDRLDGRLYRRPMESNFLKLRRRAGVTLVIGDGGLGKTNWSAATTRSQAAVSPVVWFPAKTIRTRSLNSAIATAVYGVSDPAKLHELTNVLRSMKQVLLVIVDAIDECDDYELLWRHLQDFSAQSALASNAHVVLTCRTEAVRTFEEISQGGLPADGHDDNSRRLYLAPLRESESEQLLRRLDATPAEVEELKRSLPSEFFGNPLYLDIARQLQLAGRLPAEGARWIDTFADHYVEEIATRLRGAARRPSKGAVRSALAQLAYEALQDPQGAESRNITHPLVEPGFQGEGTFLERAMQSGLLVLNGERVRFCHALLCEYFSASYIASMESITATQKVDLIARLPGRRSLALFAAQADASLLGPIAQSHPALIPNFDSANLTASMKRDLSSRASELLKSDYPSEREAGIRVLTTLRTHEATAVAVAWFNGLGQERKFACLDDAAELFLGLELKGAVQIVALHRSLRGPSDFAWYEPSFATALESCDAGFKNRLADHAYAALESARDDPSERSRLVILLAHLRDERLLPNLSRVVEKRPLEAFEHRALIHLNSDDAMQVYSVSRERYYRLLDEIGDDDDTFGSRNSNIWHTLVPHGCDILYFSHDALVRFVEVQLQSENFRDVSLGLEFADMLQNHDLIDVYALAVAERLKRGFVPFYGRMIHKLVAGMSPRAIVELFETVKTREAKVDILQAAGVVPSPQIEALLMGALDDQDLFAAACVGLSKANSHGAGPRIHEKLLSSEGNHRYLAIKALGRARYQPALQDLIALLQDPATDGNTSHVLVVAIGLIGGQEASDALFERYGEHPTEDILSVFVDATDDHARRSLHRLLDEYPVARRTLGMAIAHRRFHHDDTVYYHDEPPPLEFKDEKLLAILLSWARECIAETTCENYNRNLHYAYDAIALFDSSKATRFFEELASRDSSLDPETIQSASSFSRRLLAQRGNSIWARSVIEEELERIGMNSWISERDVDALMRWPREHVHDALLKCAQKEPARWLFLFARFANNCDHAFIRDNLNSVTPELADMIKERLPTKILS